MERATAQLRAALEKSKGTAAYQKAVDRKDAKALTALLIRNGAPADSRVVGAPGPSGPAFWKFTCCSKKKWGPVTIEN